MTGLFILALIMGGAGSLHCIGMCGPIALSLPVVNSNTSSRFTSTLLYNLGRVTTYSLLGAAFGLLGNAFGIFGYQQWLSIGLGVVIMIFAMLPKKNFKKSNLAVTFFEKLRRQLGDLFARKNYHSVYFIGILNGLLPCGLVYMAVAGAISTASVFKSALFMACFGLGTLPMIWGIAFFGGAISWNIRNKIKRLYPYMMVLMALLLIVRGLGLNIPYISPSVSAHSSITQPAVECHN